jgi:4-amino-4-deoxy-L-arabinose transferase-like glycosyltransferase
MNNSFLKTPMVNKSTVWWLSGIMLLGALLRLSIYNLEPLFMDSAYYASLGRSIAEGDYLLQVNHMSDKPPLFFYVQALFFQLLGVSESVAVLPSFLGGMISIGIIYLLGRDLKNSVAGFIAAFLYAISPGSVWLSAWGLADSLFMTVTLLSFWTLMHRRFYWTGLLIGVAFGMKQTILSFGPLYFLCLLIIEFHNHSGKEALNSVSKSVFKMMPGFFSVFLPVLYWSMFLTSERMKLFKLVSEFISGTHDTNFVGTPLERLSSLQRDLGEVVGLSWHWIIGLLMLSLLFFIGKLYSKWQTQKPFELSVKLLLCINIFILFFFYLLIFVAHKYNGFWYVFPVFPLLILTGSITLVELLNTRYLSWNRNARGKIIISILVAITLISTFSFATARVNQIGENLRNTPHQAVQEVIKVIKPYLLNGDNFIFEENLGWMLRYYLFGEKYRNLHYDFGDQNMENMKSVLFQEPYTNFYVLLYLPRFGDIVPISQALSPEYKVEEIFRNKSDNFRFYKIGSVFPESLNNTQNLPEEWGKEWETWWYNILVQKWPEAKNIEISSQWNETAKQFEVKLVAEEVPFNKKNLVVSKIQVSIKSPKPSIAHSIFYNWPIFQEHQGISMQLLINGETMEKSILEKFKQVKKIQFRTEQSFTNIHAFGQVETTSLEIDTDVHLKLESELVRVEIQRFLLNNWDLTWLTSMFKNHPIPPFKINTYPSLVLRLANVKQQKGLITFEYDAPERLSK